MKYMTIRNKKYAFNLQFFAGEDGGDDGGDAGEDGDDQTDEESDENGEDAEEKKYSEKDMEEAIKKRLARERRKWQRKQEASGRTESGKPDKDNDPEETQDAKARKAAEDKVSKMEVKIACFEADVAKESVDDVSALAKAYMEADEDLDLEEAIEKVVKKYPHFKKSAVSSGDGEEETRNKAWGQRQKGSSLQKPDGVEAAFMKRNPGLKVD